MPAPEVVIGVDSSTQSAKAVFVEAATGRILAAGRAEHRVTGEAGARESDPEGWWRALCEAVAEGFAGAGVPAAAVTGIAVAGQQHGLVVLDRSGRPLRPAALWNDTRAAPQAAALARVLGGPAGWAARTGSVPVAAVTAAKWQWLREHEPRAADAAAAVRLPHDFLTERLTGTAVTDPGDASGTGWYATGTGAYDRRTLEHIGLDPVLLPEIAPTGATRVGPLTASAAAALGLLPGIAVAAGTGDNMAAAVGLGLGGAGLLGRPVLSLGTSGTVYAATRARPVSPALSGFAATDGTFLPLGCTLNCTLAVDKMAALLGLDREAAEPGGEVVLLPYLDGERTPDLPAASGLLTGLRHITSREQLLGAAYEGAVVTVLRALDEVSRACGQDPAGPGAADVPLRLIGGGAAGRHWVETVRRLSGRPLLLPHGREPVATGAAALAASAATGEDPVALAIGWGAGEGTELPATERDIPTWERVVRVLDRAGGTLLS
ncbi:xylulose kinase [Streptomyces inusitatus]|uniref:Xylulose kinase n=1 Tax=Streptomyces inusitatus TaxID=68221 RepID=A0A918Q4G9_9ACTN|nr:xylulokinase [Streptomyces inusitatus]GGZ33517.1 xylulose kinase [Streptomyces inusitatus]